VVGPSLLDALQRALEGRDALLPLPAGDPRQSELLRTALRAGEDIDDDVALVVATSGTTGTPKGAMLTAAALTVSASATHARLGGSGTWLLALPPHHIAGLQVLVRSALAGTTPVELDVSRGFDVSLLPAAVAAMGTGRRYTSLVATQVAKALQDPAATEALAELDAVLLGGGPAPSAVLEGAAAAGITVVRTYGSSETAGGCVYDGIPLDGVQVRLDSTDATGRIVLGGPTVAKGYRNPADPDPFVEPGWFRTDDAGVLADGVLQVVGRIDEAITTGGLKILPQPVEAVLLTHPAVADCAVFGVPDERLGQRVVAALVVAGDVAPSLAELRARVGESLDLTAAPRELHFVDELPRRGIGKPDRRALVARFST
jgi:O-succinylbenzoic acid--CoA ligase